MNSRERVMAVLRGEKPDRVPTGFWMHFPEDYFYGTPAVEMHLRYFREARPDLCKVMTENLYPCDHTISAAGDWRKVRSWDRNASFIRAQADIISRVVEGWREAPVLATLHGVVASASHTLLGVQKYNVIGRYAQLYHLRMDPEAVEEGYRRIADTLCVMAEEFVRAGAEGIFYAGLGGESDGFTDEEFERYIAPLDKMVLEAAYTAGARFVVLHMCKPKVRLQRYLSYPCDIVNWGVEESGVSISEGRQLFPDKVILGGINNKHGGLIDGDEAALEREVLSAIREAAGGRFILGSDCTLPGSVPFASIARISEIAEKYRA
ncbi:MAG: uroporphyrinogen III decarboxylase [Clostridia bacterium]|nr:uroporphyrinogen III decarboxylase [Clostridia bacterium]